MAELLIQIKKYRKRLACYVKSRFAAVNERPVVVLGNQKSGTSAIAHLLADFGGLSKTIDIPPLWSPVVLEIMRGQIDFANLVRRNKFYFSTDLIKEPSMTFITDHVIERFPNARYIFIIRDPRDNIRSILNRINVPGHLPGLDGKPFKIKSSQRIMLDASTWGGNKTENYVEALAHKWNKAVDNYVFYRERMILAKYEEFLADKYGFIANLAKQLGITERVDIKDKLDVQYQPRGDRNVLWKDFFGIENLMRLERICSTWMKEFGYSESSK